MGDRIVRGWSAVVAGCVLALVSACTAATAGTGAEAPSSPPIAAPAGATTDVVAPPVDTTGLRLEAHRLAAATALVETSFPDRAERCDERGPYLAAADLEPYVFPPGTATDALDRYGFVVGWAQCAQDATGAATITLSIELSDPVSAASAIREMVAGAAQSAGRRPAAAAGGATVLTRTDGTTDTVQVWTAVGRTVAYTAHEAPAGQGVDGALRLNADQVRLLTAFTPTPQDQVPGLPLDPDGLAALVLEPPGTRGGAGGPFDPEAYLRVVPDPVHQRELLTGTGLTAVYVKDSEDAPLNYSVTVFAFPGASQTNAAYEGFAKLELQAFGGVAFRLPSIPDAPCASVEYASPKSPRYVQRCYVGYGGHLASIDVSGLTAPDDVATMDRLLPAERDLIDR
jgi:hypothetical protein